MKAAAFNPRPVVTPRPIMVDRTEKVRWVGWLILVYIVLLIIEGALRKWVAPRFSDPLLVIRDPVLLLIYAVALRAHVFPFNRWVISLGIIGLLSFAISFYFLAPYLSWIPLTAVTLYGFRSNYLHMPLIFIIASVFDEGDVKRIGWWILLCMIPLSVLMVAQFKASPDSFINGTAGMAEGAEQLGTAGGKIRPAGTFSFISGPIFYTALTAAFLIYGILTRATYKFWLLIASGIALVVATGVSGSRACVMSVLLVVGTMVVILVVRPKAVNQVGRVLLVVVIGVVVIARLPVFKEGINVLSERFTQAAEEQEATMAGGMLRRVAGGFTEGLTNLDKFPAAGWGLGLGTNVGARFLVGGAAFLFSENEWTRILYESGPLLGLAFLFWRTALVFYIGYLGLRALQRDATLPILLFSSGFYILWNGQLGQPTTLGFAVVVCGLSLAALQKSKADSESGPDSSEDESIVSVPAPKPLPRRSAFASRLHGANPPADQPNGLTDR